MQAEEAKVKIAAIILVPAAAGFDHLEDIFLLNVFW